MPVDENVARERLEARKRELLEQSEMSAGDRATVTLDQQSVGRLSRMDAMQQQAMSQAQERARAGELLRIDQAFRRLADGEYGYCTQCGEEIPDERLKIDPSAATCVKCVK